MKRLPIIRHARYYYWLWQVNRHYDFWRSMGFLGVNASSDYAHLDAIWRGER